MNKYIKLDTEATGENFKSLTENLELAERQLELKNIEFDKFVNLYAEVTKTLAEKVALEDEILQKYKKLADVGATAELQFMQQRNTVQEVKGLLRENP